MVSFGARGLIFKQTQQQIFVCFGLLAIGSTQTSTQPEMGAITPTHPRLCVCVCVCVCYFYLCLAPYTIWTSVFMFAF